MPDEFELDWSGHPTVNCHSYDVNKTKRRAATTSKYGRLILLHTGSNKNHLTASMRILKYARHFRTDAPIVTGHDRRSVSKAEQPITLPHIVVTKFYFFFVADTPCLS